MSFSPSLRGIISMVLSGLTFVSCDAFLKLLVQQVPPLQALVLRGAGAIVFTLVLLAIVGQLKHLPKAFGFWTLARAAAEVVAVTAFIIALAQVPLADITAIYQIAPLVVLAGASFLWGEKVGLLRWLLIGLGLAGALLVAQPGTSGASPYALLGFITAVASAARDLLSRKAPDDAPGLIIAFTTILCVFSAAVVINQLFETWVPVTPELALYGMISGFFVMLGHFFVFMAFRLTTARTVAPFYYTFTLVAVLFGAVFFNEWPNALAIGGIALIIICGLGVLFYEERKVKA